MTYSTKYEWTPCGTAYKVTKVDKNGRYVSSRAVIYLVRNPNGEYMAMTPDADARTGVWDFSDIWSTKTIDIRKAQRVAEAAWRLTT